MQLIHTRARAHTHTQHSVKLWASNVPSQHFLFPDGSGVTGISRVWVKSVDPSWVLVNRQIRERDLPEECVSLTFTGVGPERRKKGQNSSSRHCFYYYLFIIFKCPSTPVCVWRFVFECKGSTWAYLREGEPTAGPFVVFIRALELKVLPPNSPQHSSQLFLQLQLPLKAGKHEEVKSKVECGVSKSNLWCLEGPVERIFKCLNVNRL